MIEKHYKVWCDGTLRGVLKEHIKVYGYKTKFVLTPLTINWGSEEEVIYSRAAARFQHLINLEAL